MYCLSAGAGGDNYLWVEKTHLTPQLPVVGPLLT